MRVSLPDQADRDRRREMHDAYAPYEVRVASRIAEKRRFGTLEVWAVVGLLVVVVVGWEIMHPILLR